MATKNLNLGIVPVSRGEFNSTTIYYKDNIVQYKRGSYQVVSESPIIGVPPTNDKNIVNPGWTLFAGTLDAQDVVNQIKEQEAKSIQAVANREAEILAKSDAAEVSFNNTGTSFSGTNVQDALKETNGKLSKLESEVIYDVTANNNGATFPSLSALLSSENLSTLIPTSVRHGGMSVRFVQSSDNKYVQYRCVADEFTTDTAQWQGVDEKPTAGSDNLVKSGGVDGVLEEIEKATIGYKDGNTFNISSSYLTRRKDFTYIPIEAGKSYAVKVTAFTGAEISGNRNGVWFYSSADSADVPKAALVRQVGALYEFTCVNAGVLRVYCLSGAENDSVECDFTLFDSDSLETKKADDNVVVKHSSQSLTDDQKSQARTNIGAASVSSTPTKTEFDNLKSFVDDNVVKLDKEQITVTEKYTKSSFDAEHSANAYLRFGINSLQENASYYCVWLYAEKDGYVYLGNAGMRPRDNRMAVGSGTITSYPNATKYEGETDTFPSEKSPKAVSAGDLIAISFLVEGNYSANDVEIVFEYSKDKKYIPNENIKKYDDVLGLLNNHIVIKKVSNDEIRLHIPTKDGSKYLIHPMKHNRYTHDMTEWGGSAAMVCGDNWDPGDITDSAGNNIIQGNLNFIYMIDSSVEGFENENLHVGTGGGSTAGHGLEVREYTKFFADGKEFTPEGMTDDIVCSVFRMIQKSNCYAADKSKNPSSTPDRNYENWPKLSSGNPVVTAQHFVDAVYKVGNNIAWRNRLVIKRNGVVFNQLHGGMLRSFTSKLNEVVVNDLQSSRNHFEYNDGQYIITPIGDSVNLTNVNRYADEATMYGDGIVVHQRMIQDDGTRFKKSIMSCTDYHSTNLLSFKCYFMPALVSERSTVSAAETFNNNDIISVTNYREIDVW